mgnify:CR=1 FL=1
MSCMCRKCGGESVMVELDHVVEEVLKVINDNGFSQKGAFNLRQNGTSICHGDSEHIKIKKKTDKRESISILMAIQRARKFTSRWSSAFPA